MERDFDVILYGATGFTGRQTVEYFARHAPHGLRWAIAGRNRQKLEALQSSAPIITADARNREQVYDLVSCTRVLLTTAGPFALYGDELVAGCVKAGTHYVDITGETAWVRSLIDRHHQTASRQGTRIIPSCGFDSVPADLGVSLLVERLGDSKIEAKAYFEMKGGCPNGGTVASGIQAYESGAAKRMRDRFLLSPGMNRPLHPIEEDPASARASIEMWAVGLLRLP